MEKKGKREKEQMKSSYMCIRYYFEMVRSGQRSRAWPTTTVQLIVRGGYLQNIHEVITIWVRELRKIHVDQLIT